jgi:hypothetical protein
MKQTAVEWLEDKYKKLHIPIPKALFDHAKEMEKQQIIEAYCNGDDNISAQQYYNETFKSE